MAGLSRNAFQQYLTGGRQLTTVRHVFLLLASDPPIDAVVKWISANPGSIVQWLSLVVSAVAIVLTIRSTRRQKVRDLREQVNAVFIRLETISGDTPESAQQISMQLINQSPQSIWDVTLKEVRSSGVSLRRIDSLGETRSDARNYTNIYHSSSDNLRATLYIRDYLGRAWERRVDKPQPWKPSREDVEALFSKAPQ